MKKVLLFSFKVLLAAVSLIALVQWIVSFDKFPTGNIYLLVSVFHLIFFMGLLVYCVATIKKAKEIARKDYIVILGSIAGISMFAYSVFLLLDMKTSYANTVAIYPNHFCVFFNKNCDVSRRGKGSLEYNCGGKSALLYLKSGTIDRRFTRTTKTEFKSAFLKSGSNTTTQYAINTNQLLVNMVPNKSHGVIPFSNCKGLTTEHDRILIFNNQD